MKQMTSEMKQQQIEWRRAKVLELSSQGYTEIEIARFGTPKTTGPGESSKTYS